MLGRTARRQEGGQRREAAATPRPVREAREPPAGIEPAPRPYKGRVLPLTLRRQRWRRQESNLRPLVASEVLYHQSFVPKVRTDGVEPPQPEASGLQPVELTHAQRPRERGSRSDSNRHCGIHGPGCLPLHHGHHVTETTGFEPATFRLTSECSPR